MARNRLDVILGVKDRELQAGMKRAQKSVRDFGTAAGGAGQAANLLGNAMTLGAGAGALYMAREVGQAAWELGKLGAQSLEMRDSFDEMARQAGGSSDAIVAAIKRASDGTVAEMDIIAAANRGILLGLGAQADKWEELTEVARFRARAMGMDVTTALDDITTGIGRESKMILDNLGIIVDLDEVMGDYAKTLGKSADELSGAERKQALLNSVIEEGGDMIEAAGGIAETSADQFRALDAATADLKTALAEDLAPVLADIATAALPAVESAAIALGGTLRLLIGDIDGVKQKWKEAGEFQETHNTRTEESGEVYRRTASGAWILDQRLTDIEKSSREAGDAAAESTGIYDSWNLKADKSAESAKKLVPKVDAVTRAFVLLADETREWRKDLVDADISGMDPYETLGGRLDALAAVEQNEDNIAEEDALAAIDAEKEYQKAIEERARAQERAAGRLRSLITSALSGTSVTAGDMWKTSQGSYQDKWDEPARQLDAIAARGFEELHKHGDWAQALKIPPEILSANEATLKEWANQQANAYRNLERPDLLAGHIDQAVEAVKAEIMRQEAIEQSVGMIAQRLIAEGITGYTETDIAGMMGDAEASGQSTGEKLVKGMADAIADNSPTGQFIRILQEEQTNKAEQLRNAGKAAYAHIHSGVIAEMDAGDYIGELAQRLFPRFRVWMATEGAYTGGD